MSKKKLTPYQMSRRATLKMLGAAGATTAATTLLGSNKIWMVNAASENPVALTATDKLNELVRQALIPANAHSPIIRDISQMSCVTKPALTEGPFFVDEKLNRSDIRPDPSNGTIKPGTPYQLKFNVSRVAGSACTSLAGAWVDLWHCDALGGYSDVSGQGNPNNIGQKFLRGYQVSDANGDVTFQTIYPGYYNGRTTHMHYKVRMFNGTTRTFEFTSQLIFDDTLTDTVYQAAPYNTKGARGTRNNNDNIAQSGGSAILLNTASDGAGGYTSTFSLGVSGVPASVASVSAVSAASFSSNGGLAPDSIAALFGTSLASSTSSAATNPLPTTLGGVTVVVVDANNVSRSASLFFVSPTQINFVVPTGTAAGSALIYVQQNGTNIAQGTATIAATAPGLFSANASGSGLAAAVALRVRNGVQSYESLVQYDNTSAQYTAVPLDISASTDQVYLIAFGTGLRSRSSLSNVSATIGGTAAIVSYLGAQGTLTGLDQANILIPSSLSGRGLVDVILNVDGVAANTVRVQIK